jgi:hypothetical protein
MNKIKYLFIISFVFFISTSCSLVDKLKEKMSNKDEKKKEETTENKEKTIETTSGDDLTFYNKYIDVANKISETGDGLHKAYIENIPEPKSVKKGMFLVTVAYDFKVSDLERTIKDYKRSFFDGGELSKLKASDEMKKEIESSFRSLLDVLDGYYKAAKKTSDYYKDKEYESNPSKAEECDSEMKDNYNKYKDAFEKFNSAIRKYKPKKTNRDPNTISDPDEKSIAVLMNAYENTLDRAETFFEKFQKVDKKSELSGLQKDISDFENDFASEKRNVESVSFPDRTKSLKYSFEDYFSKTVSDFVRETNKFLDNAAKQKMKENEFNQGYDNVVTYYNYMINSYNTSIQSINLMNQFKY